jgi:hypothetical protein
MADILDGDLWRIVPEDNILHTATMPAASVDFAVFSPPFPLLFAYTSEACDIGNSEGGPEMRIHLSFFYRQFARILKPGRAVVVHCMQIPRLKRTGEVGLNDFRGLNIRLAERAGLVFEYDWLVRKNPQAQAIRTHSHELQFAGLEKDRARCRGCLGDYLLKFRAPGDNQTPVDTDGEVSRNDWIKWAEPCWDDIIETDTLNTAEAKTESDTRHICPLQLEVIRRCVLLFTNPDEIVFSPFAGIGSEGYMAVGGVSPKTRKRVGNPRRFYGCEIKPEYIEAAQRNLAKAVAMAKEETKLLF